MENPVTGTLINNIIPSFVIPCLTPVSFIHILGKHKPVYMPFFRHDLFQGCKSYEQDGGRYVDV